MRGSRARRAVCTTAGARHEVPPDGTSHGRALVTWMVCGALAVTGCQRGASPQGPPRGDEARGCVAPLEDLDRVDPSVQRQIRQRYAAVTELEALPDAAERRRADGHGALGMILMAATFQEAAESCLRLAAALASDDARWPYYLAQLHRTRGELAQAETYFEQVRAIEPDDLATQVWLGDTTLALDRPAEARRHFEQALALRADSLAARFGLARVALHTEDYAEAVQWLEDILARSPGTAAAHYPLGTAYRALGDDRRAAAHFRRRGGGTVSPDDPRMRELDALLDSPRAHETRGLDALDRQEWSVAAAHFRRGLELRPDDPALRHRLVTTLFMMGDAVGARAEFERVAETSPGYPAAHYSLGVLLQSTGRHAEAVEQLQAVLRYRALDPDASLALAHSLRKSGNPDTALEHYRAVLRMDPDVVDARFGRAMALVQLGRYGEAHRRLTAAVEAHPDQPLLAHALARILAAAPDARLRNGDRALALMEQIQRHDRSVDVGETMAMSLAELGRHGEAVAIQRQLVAATQDAGFPGVTRRLVANLERYERGQAARVPWPPGEVP